MVSASARSCNSIGGQYARKALVLAVISDDPLTEAEVEAVLNEYQPEVNALLVAPAFAPAPAPGYEFLERPNQTPPVGSASFRRAMAQHILAEAEVAARRRGLSPIQTLLRPGDPATAILAMAAAESPDLLVLRSRDLGNRANDLMGGVSYQVVRQAACSVITVKDPNLED